MFIAILEIKFYLHGCLSLKEKRHRIGGLRDKYGSNKNLAVCESGTLDSKQRAELSFVCAANDKKTVESILSKIIDYCESSIDAELTHHKIEWV
ncbi:DUF503 domain-containing protein [Agarilytica rhodophyticola]|uniref:DUF503 domain-containing protein n=1 Tax=Agarilytica rhodophyticola TaxID=1737490 RepID=UPI000B348FEF|nr:DUF503 domain-containing protein [Agarilytica rhodophyticola]